MYNVLCTMPYKFYLANESMLKVHCDEVWVVFIIFIFKTCCGNLTAVLIFGGDFRQMQLFLDV